MAESTNGEIDRTIRTGMLALVAVLGAPAAAYFVLRGPFGAGLANVVALAASVGVALAVLALLAWHEA